MCLVERIRQILEQILRTSALRLAHRIGFLAQHISKYLHLAPQIVINHPFHQFAHRLRPRLIVQNPEQAASLPCRHDRALRDVPEHIIIRQVGQRSHVSSQMVGQFVQRLDDESPLADAEFHQILIQFLIESIVVFTLSRNLTLASLSGLVGENHSAESTVEEFVLIELAGGIRGG